MMPLDFLSLAQQCAPQIAPATMTAIVRTESGFNPYAIGVVHGRLRRQPSNAAEAVATVRMLEAAGWNFSVGLAQVNRANWLAYGLTPENAFEPCRNLTTGAAILERCFAAALKFRQFHPAADYQVDVQTALRAGLSCYASGNFSTGYQTRYVHRVVENAAAQSSPKPSVPAIAPIPVVPIDSAAPIRAPWSRSAIPQPSRQGQDGVNAASPATDPQREPDGSAVVF
ncbi:lytic transglycosylase [Burkholderia ubonensis]|uniref:Lytic transglycosylase n=2 Tax=Burkholderia cepacia complex TaxID=87882 RepID=A0A1B4PZA3_BURCE|nr:MULTISPECIES: lytic transglycosylase domain-containing protein [Burkholderia cepacia complex]AOK19214.1 lytic transglycosylase [Burkholderia cepacia]AOK25972.1 lytic transglycosylase [Burkholderia ubonensis]KVU58860.1 lytic transglycosylase [Burkholderia cepacia]KWC49784.1 lytic transglycosylase [Burkholderia ubonensis]